MGNFETIMAGCMGIWRELAVGATDVVSVMRDGVHKMKCSGFN